MFNARIFANQGGTGFTPGEGTGSDRPLRVLDDPQRTIELARYLFISSRPLTLTLSLTLTSALTSALL